MVELVCRDLELPPRVNAQRHLDGNVAVDIFCLNKFLELHVVRTKERDDLVMSTACYDLSRSGFTWNSWYLQDGAHFASRW
ncbi:unnamed protein product [Aphanomyces euteiches]